MAARISLGRLAVVEQSQFVRAQHSALESGNQQAERTNGMEMMVLYTHYSIERCET